MIWEFILLFVLGLAVGSFLTVVVERFDTAESFWSGRSHCNHCKKVLTAWELIPFFGFFLLRGKCQNCNKAIPHIYPLFELLTGLAFVGVAYAFGPHGNYWLLPIELLVVSVLLVLCFYDWLNQAFPAVVLYLALGTVVIDDLARIYGGGHIFIQHVSDPLFTWLSSPGQSYLTLLVGGIVGAGLLGLLAFPSQGRWMGYGDVILAGILGLWLGYPLIIFGLLGAFYSGAIIGGWQLYAKRATKDHRIPFGPFLIFGALVAEAWGNQLFHAIIKLWGIQ